MATQTTPAVAYIQGIWVEKKTSYDYTVEEIVATNLNLENVAETVGGGLLDKVSRHQDEEARQLLQKALETWLVDDTVELQILIPLPREEVKAARKQLLESTLAKYPGQSLTFLFRYNGEQEMAPVTSSIVTRSLPHQGLVSLNERFVARISQQRLTESSLKAEIDNVRTTMTSELSRAVEALEKKFESEFKKEKKDNAQARKDLEKSVRKLEKELDQVRRDSEKSEKAYQKESEKSRQDKEELTKEMLLLRKGHEELKAWKDQTYPGMAAILRRYILDRARLKAFRLLGNHDPNVDPWTLGTEALVDAILPLIPELPYRPSRDAVKMFCGPSEVRKRGNEAAHEGAKGEVAQAILAHPEGDDRTRLIEIFRFIYEGEEPQLVYASP